MMWMVMYNSVLFYFNDDPLSLYDIYIADVVIEKECAFTNPIIIKGK